MTNLPTTTPPEVRPTSALTRRLPAELAAYSDHGSLHGTVLRAVGGSAGGVLVADILARVLGFGLLDSPVLPMAIAAGALAAVAARGKNWVKGVVGGALGLGGGALFAATAPYWSPFAALLYGASMVPVLAPNETWKRRTITGVVAGALASAGVYVGHVIMSWDLFGGMVPGPLASAAAGAAAGLFVGLAGAPRHLARPADPVELAYLEALMIKDGELHEILSRTLAIHRAVRADLEGGDPARGAPKRPAVKGLEARGQEPAVASLGEQVGDMTMRILHIADQCRQIEADLAAAPGFELAERIASLEQKAANAEDEAARETYRSAIATLDGQRQNISAIERGRERVVARLHANVALLEKVRFSLVHLRSADAERFGGEASPVTEAIDELGREIDATSMAVGEVYGAPDGLPAPTTRALPSAIRTVAPSGIALAATSASADAPPPVLEHAPSPPRPSESEDPVATDARAPSPPNDAPTPVPLSRARGATDRDPPTEDVVAPPRVVDGRE